MTRIPLRWIHITFIVLLLVILVIVIVYLNELNWMNASNSKDDSKDILSEIDPLMEDAVNKGMFAGGTVLVAQGDKILYHRSFGYAVKYADEHKTLVNEPVKATNETIYDLASISKIYTAMAVMKLVEDGQLDLDAPVSRYLPSFRTPEKQQITVRQLLTHTSGLPASLPLDSHLISQNNQLMRLQNVKPVEKPGTKVIYSDVGYIVLGQLVERVSGMPLDQYMNLHIFQPLQLKSTSFRPPQNQRKRIAATEVQRELGRGLVWGEVHDENAWAMNGVAGHAGLFGTAEDLWKVAKCFLPINQKSMVLSKEVSLSMGKHLTKGIEGPQRGLGFEWGQDWYMGSFAAEGAFGHTGFTGTSFFIAPNEGIVVILLTNRVHPVRTGPSINPVRKELAEIVYRYTVENEKE